MLTRRHALTMIGLAAGSLFAADLVFAGQKAPKPKTTTVTLTVDGMT